MDIKTCESCGGAGAVEVPITEWPHNWTEQCDCIECGGSGFVMDTEAAAMREYLVLFDENLEGKPAARYTYTATNVIPY